MSEIDKEKAMSAQWKNAKGVLDAVYRSAGQEPPIEVSDQALKIITQLQSETSVCVVRWRYYKR